MTHRTALADLIADQPYQAYSYSYPHKTSYRAIEPPVALADLWRGEERSALLLYLHVPFCEQRCGFCNLFTQVQPKQDLVSRYLAALERQAEITLAALAPAKFSRLAIGGGTPTFLRPNELERLFAIAVRFGATGVPSSVEVSPSTADAERIDVLRQAGVTRISMGIQSFLPAETAAINRHQDAAIVARACRTIADAKAATFNLDLMYGLPGQTAPTLLESIARAIDAGANELYLYPLYVRPLTILGVRQVAASAERLALYRAARAALLERGWTQASMRMFRAPTAQDVGGPTYRCQDDGMVGLGIGARSYTRALHYSHGYAVDQGQIRRLIAEWSELDQERFRFVDHGIQLTEEDQRRRFVILSVLERGVDRSAYRERFGANVFDHLPELTEAIDLGLMCEQGDVLCLTNAGLEQSDVIGLWLYSERVQQRMATYHAR